MKKSWQEVLSVALKQEFQTTIRSDLLKISSEGHIGFITKSDAGILGFNITLCVDDACSRIEISVSFHANDLDFEPYCLVDSEEGVQKKFGLLQDEIRWGTLLLATNDDELLLILNRTEFLSESALEGKVFEDEQVRILKVVRYLYEEATCLLPLVPIVCDEGEVNAQDIESAFRKQNVYVQ